LHGPATAVEKSSGIRQVLLKSDDEERMAVLRRLALIVALGLGVGGLALPTVTHADDVQTYVVVDGDTLIGIASKSGVRLSDLLRENDLRLNSLILPGQRLDIPASSGASAPPTSTSGSSSSSAASSGSTHVVRWGDTLSGIASRNGVSLSSLLRANQLSLSSLIVPGMRLTLPSGAAAAATSTASSAATPSPSGRSGATHVVRSGDTLSGIAARYRVSLASLLEVNAISTTSLIVPGMQVALPAGSNKPSAGGASTPSGEQPAATGVAAVVDYALAQVGKPYRFFSKGPDAFDCSGLTLAAYRQIGIDLVHYSASQARRGTSVDFRNEPIRPGDLVFQARRGSERINHVGMAITSTTWIQAVGTGQPVRVGPMPARTTITAVRRMVDTA
jgi:peptidoglycan endopeptidase LytE